jgi:exodeoxyribonuclease VIII
MKFGSTVHAALLEPERFEKEWVLKPASVDLRTKEGKGWASENAGKKIVSISEAEAISAIRARLSKSQTWSDLCKGGFAETCLYEEMGGVLLKGRMDLMSCTGDRVDIIDLKTTTDASPSFYKQALNYGYHIQAALYSDLAAKIFKLPVRFIWVAIESEEPYGVGFYEPDAQTLALGRGKVMGSIKILKECETLGFDRTYPDKIMETNLPRWAELELMGEF